jgi:predicted heme/steroid binding protein
VPHENPALRAETGMKQLTVEELKQFDGKEGRPAYIAFNGKIYDVSQSGLWDSGSHFEHMAGMDLTEIFKDAPHGEEVLERVPVVGELT